MRRCGTFALAAALVACAPVAQAATGRAAAVIPLQGRVDEFLVESFHKRVGEALRAAAGDGKKEGQRAVDLLLFELQTTPGALAQAQALADAIDELGGKAIETVALVRGQGSASDTLLGLASARLFLADTARLEPLAAAAFDPRPSPEAHKQLLEALERYSKRRPRFLALYRGFGDPAAEVHAVALKGRGGETAFYDAAAYKRLKADPATAVLKYELVAEAGALPKLSAADAERLGVAEGTAATIGAVATRLGLSGSDLRTLPQKGRAAVAEAPPPEPKGTRSKPAGTGNTVVFIPLDGMVGDGMLHSLKRRLREMEELSPALVVFEMNTYGGKLASALDIGNVIFDLPKPRTVAYVNDKAISAGALISVACDEIFMTAGSELGDCGVVTTSGEEVGSEKIDTLVRARFRSFCEGKYPSALAMAMVTKDLEVVEAKTREGKNEYLTGPQFENLTPDERERYVSHKKIVHKGELLTMTDTEAKRYGFSKATVRSREEILEAEGLAGRTIVTLDWNWSEKLVRLLDTIGPLLLTLGILGIIIELKTPGFGVFGIVGLALVAVFFFGKYTAGLAEVWEILLFFIGIVLLAIEIFVTPGFGIVGVVGLLAILASLALSLQPFTVPTQNWEWKMFRWNIAQLGGVAFAVFAGAVLIARYLHRAPYLGKIVLASPPPSTTPTAVTESISPPPRLEDEKRRAEALVGKRGRAVTMLRPAGRAEFDGEPFDVVTEGDFIRPGDPIEIADVRGNRVLVRRIT